MSNSTSHQRNSPWMLLRQQVGQTFSESELKELCFYLGLDFDELGQGVKTDKIINLVSLAQQQGQLADLLSAVAVARTHISWPTLEVLQASINEHPYPYTRPFIKLTREEQLAQRNRQTMLLKVKAYWIDGVLANSLHSKVIPLDMERKPDAVTRQRPWDMLWQHRDQQLQPLPPGTRIIDRFNYAAGDALLILGKPGSGKTTMLLELAGELLEWAGQNEALRIPVVFNLSSWATKQPPLTEWLVSELQTLYLIPKKVAQAWIEQDDILPLLDGLDEVAQEHRVACIKAINAYRKAQGTPLVVCSRIADYEAIGEKLLLSDALLLRPLTPDQINDYLLAGGLALHGVRLALQEDETFQEMAQSPLMLSIMGVAYRDQTPEQFTSTNLDERGRQLFEVYIRRQLSQRKNGPSENSATTLHQLAYLAHQMTHHDQIFFLIERIQPDWLPETQYQHRYRWTAKVFFGSVSGLICAISFGMFIELTGGLVFGLIWGVAIGLVLFGASDDIHPVEKVHWFWKRPSRKSLISWPTATLIGGIFLGLVLGLLWKSILGLILGLVLGLWLSLFLWIDGGLADELIDLKTMPNEGVRNSARNSVYVGLFVWFILGLPFGSFFDLYSGLLSDLFRKLLEETVSLPFEELYIGAIGKPVFWESLCLVAATAFAVNIGLTKAGGEAVIKHYCLRFYLHRYGYLPLNLVPFLDLTSERLILQKVGGGYRFVHRLLQEYLASLYVEDDKANAEAKRPS